MSYEEARYPLFATALPEIRWIEYGERTRIDPALGTHFDYSVYRYASIAEALMTCRGRVSFSAPNRWPDKYESHLMRELFMKPGPFASATPFVKCLSVEHSSEAMWRTYSGPGGVVRLSMALRELVDGLDRSQWPFDAKIYVGRVRYMDPPRLRREVDRLKQKKIKAVMNKAMPALLMKRSGFAFENEIRIAFLPASQKDIPPVVTAERFPIETINRILLDPYLPSWQTDELVRIFKKGVSHSMEVRQSLFDMNPADFARAAPIR